MMPTKGALVRLKNGAPERRGLVQKGDQTGQGSVSVLWYSDRSLTKHHYSQLSSSLEPGHDVLHEAAHLGMESLGHGTVLSTRTVAGAVQHLVEFWQISERRWMPWQRLSLSEGADGAFRALPRRAGDAEALRLRNLAYALSEWDMNTGGLTRLEIDPLPHQIYLVNRILASGDLNWMIADDVGLGKTIEVGLLITALLKRLYRRFLIIAPAGLTRQWEEELRDKFLLDDFVVYGETATPVTPAQWRLYDRMIVSMDRVKHENHLPNFLQAPDWDVVVVDEAHRLSRHEYGFKYNATDRYAMAQTLRPHANAMLLLSGTPHQGRDDLFRGLLELLRPGREWHQRFLTLQANPGILSSMIIRNRKADVTDQFGNFVFRGKTATTVHVPRSPAEAEFERVLVKYLREGYAASSLHGPGRNAIGFVMTTFRKLAASSLAAIEKSLRRRAARLQGEAASLAAESSVGSAEDGPDRDERYVESDEQVVLADGDVAEFFSGEIEVLQELIAMAQMLMPTDTKVSTLFDTVLASILAQDPDRKVLFFTEYRTTQEVLVNELAKRFGRGTVTMIHGGQPMPERRAEVDAFNNACQFLVSTEAGGEGLNLHRNCNVMVNFDLPWNPMRLIQRVGRLYRYGQEERVVVFNVKVEDTLDQEILNGMYERLDRVASDMASVTSENREGLIEDILGQLVGALDVSAILEEALTRSESYSKERIEEAIRRAQEAAKAQDLLLKYASGFDPSILEGRFNVSIDHLKAFVGAMMEATGIEITARVHGGDVWDIRLPERWQVRLGRRQNVRISFDRAKARRFKGELLDGDHPLLKALLDEAKHDHRGKAAFVDSPDLALGYSALVRWLDESGRPADSEYVGISRDSRGAWRVNDAVWLEWLLKPAKNLSAGAGPTNADMEEIGKILEDHLAKRGPKNSLADSPYAISGFVGD